MLAGEPPFTGSTAQAIVAKVMTEKPVAAAPGSATPCRDAVEDAVLTALAKLPADRFASAAEFASALAASRRPRLHVHACFEAPRRRAGCVSCGRPWRPPPRLAALWGWLRPAARASPDSPPLASPCSPPNSAAPRRASSVRSRSRPTAPPSSTPRWPTARTSPSRHELDADEGTPLPGVPKFLAGYTISKDGEEFIGYVAGAQTFYRFPIAGGNGWPCRASWAARIWPGPPTAPSGSAASGTWTWAWAGSVRTMSSPIRSASATCILVPMEILPGDRTALVTSRPFGASAGPALLLDLQSGETEPLLNVDIVQAGISAGHLVYAMTNGTLEAVPIDLQRRRLVGRPVTIATGVSLTGTGAAQFAVSANGTVAYVPEAAAFARPHRSGRWHPARRARPAHNYHSPRFSPDGRRLAVDFTTIDGRDVWLAELASGAVTRATFNRDGHDASWGPDGRFLTFISATRASSASGASRPAAPSPPSRC